MSLIFQYYYPAAEKVLPLLTNFDVYAWNSIIQCHQPVSTEDMKDYSVQEGVEILSANDLLPEDMNELSFQVHQGCATCGGSGFTGYGQSYGDICDDCAGSPTWMEAVEHPSDLVGLISWASLGKKKISTLRSLAQELIHQQSLEQEFCFCVERKFSGDAVSFYPPLEKSGIVFDMFRHRGVPKVECRSLVLHTERMAIYPMRPRVASADPMSFYTDGDLNL